MLTLPFDIRVEIATKNAKTYYWMTQCDPDIAEYIKTLEGRRKYVKVATVKIIGKYYVEYRLFGKIHRENDKPAIIYNNGDLAWFYNGKEHRENGMPSYLGKDFQSWRLHGCFHRENDLPALVFSAGSKEWRYNGDLHRENNMPAVIYLDGQQEWWYNGKFIRRT